MTMSSARAWLLGAALVLAAPGAAPAQVFVASEPWPAFTVGPLFLRGHVEPGLGPVTLDVVWGLVFPPGPARAAAGDHLTLLWPGALAPHPGLGASSPELAREVEARGFTVIEEGRVALSAHHVRGIGDEQPPEPVPGGVPFVTFVRQGGPLGLTAPASMIRIPWSPRLADRQWLMSLRLSLPGAVTPIKAGWVQNVFWGERHLVTISFNDVRHRALFPLYLEHRDRIVRLADEPSQILLNFGGSDRLKIDEVSPPSSHRRLSESLESTEVVSLFLDRSEGLAPQVLTVQFTYFSGLQSWAPVLIPTLFFLLGNLAAVVVRTVAEKVSRRLEGRVLFGRGGDGGHDRQTGVILSRETLARLVPGETTHAQVLELCGPDVEQLEKYPAPDRRTLVYRGRRMVPHRRRTFLWLTTVEDWEVEHHEVEIELEQDVVRDVQASVRRSHLDRVLA